MADSADALFGFTPKKRITTYGKAARRRVQPRVVGTLRHTESAPVIPTFSKSSSGSPEFPSVTMRLADTTKSGQNNTKKYGAGARVKPAVEEAQSQPSSGPSKMKQEKDEAKRAKKRRLTREESDQGKPTGPYSTPDSSPTGDRSPVGDNTKCERSKKTASVSGQTTPERDVDMRDNAPISMPFSAKTARTLKNLSISSNSPDVRRQMIPLRLSVSSRSKPAPKTTPPSQPSASSAQALSPAQPVRKRRLIDALAAQAEEESSSSDSDDHVPSAQPSGSRNAAATIPPRFAFSESNLSHASLASPSGTIPRPIMAATKKAGPKFTYSQQRTMLADDDDWLLGGSGSGASLGNASSSSAFFKFGQLTKSSTASKFSYLDEEDDTQNSGAVRSLHELRQAGANSRFADEMDDILDRVGTPSAKSSLLRRGALLEVAQKIKNKDFRQQFRNHSDSGNLFKSLGDETDVVSGYAILAIVTTLLAATTSAHLVCELRSQGLATLVSRLLGQTTDITQIAKDRKQNVSKNGQMTLTTIKYSLLELPVWEKFAPSRLSPRTLALKCLDVLMQQPSAQTFAAEDELLNGEVTEHLFSIVSDSINDSDCWDFPDQPEAIDLYLSLYVLEGHSINAMQSPLSSVTWTREYAPIVASTLEKALEKPVQELADLENLALRISLNITNHNEEASRLFAERGLLRRLAESACSAFGIVVNTLRDKNEEKELAAVTKVLESLIMMLGAMINFCVYYPPASGFLQGDGGRSEPLDGLMKIFAENHAKTADADSMEETQLNVALGYLSILLGYLCLRSPIRSRFVEIHPQKGLQPLLDSIKEFIAFHQKIAEAQDTGLGSGHGAESAALTRLKNLVEQLADLR